MSAVRVVLVVLMSALAAGCSRPSTPSPAAVGILTGVVHLSGGPSNPTTGHPVNTGQAAPGQEVVVEDAQRKRTTTTSDATGHYSLSLPPGHYTLMCGPMPQFTITAGRTVSLDCDLAVA